MNCFRVAHGNTLAEGPQIAGLLYEYNVGDTVNANCTSSKMQFHAQLIWYINKEKVCTIERLRRMNVYI